VSRVSVIHWKAAEAKEKASRLRAAGYACDVIHEDLEVRAALRSLMAEPPSAVVVDLSRLPSQGRDVALMIRARKATRYVPLVFVDGEAEKVARVRRVLPDAVYTTWRRIRSSLKRAIAQPLDSPVVPRSQMDGYAGAPLSKKLGIKDDLVVALAGAPDGFEATLGKLPPNVTLRRRAGRRCDLTLWFVRSRGELSRRMERMRDLTAEGRLWIIWPKKSSRLASDLSQSDVRRTGLAAGLVDYKISAIDADWSGLLFTRRR
jgi:hypothetical protein